MGYTTRFTGRITIEPPLNAHEITYLHKFAETRHMHRERGPYFVNGTGVFGQNRDPDIIDINRPDPTQPNVYCQWVPTDDGTALVWDKGEKFYDAAEWMQYLIDHFLRDGAAASQDTDNRLLQFFYFSFDHVCNGTIEAQGEDPNDRWRLVVTDNVVMVEPS